MTQPADTATDRRHGCPTHARRLQRGIPCGGKVRYVHLQGPVKADAVVLPPLSRLPNQAMLLNTERTVRCATDVLPVYWKKNASVLRIKRLPQEALTTSQPLIIRLTFPERLPVGSAAVQAFEEQRWRSAGLWRAPLLPETRDG